MLSGAWCTGTASAEVCGSNEPPDIFLHHLLPDKEGKSPYDVPRSLRLAVPPGDTKPSERFQGEYRGFSWEWVFSHLQRGQGQQGA